MNRRTFHKTFGLLSAAAFTGLAGCLPAEKQAAPTFLIVSGWQTVNIGDIAHTPGLLALIDQYFPQANYYLWPRDIEGYGVEEMLKTHFPKLKILKTNKPGDTEVAMTEQVRAVFEACDVLIHGSGPHVLEINKIKLWKEQTGKPYGVCGVTEQRLSPELEKVIAEAAFFFTRETASLKIAQEALGNPTHLGFFPDATFALNIYDEPGAQVLLQRFGLAEKDFICIVPRLRFTPYYKIHSYVKWTDDKIAEVNTTNDRYKEQDHEKLRRVIIGWVRETGKKVLICPEMAYQLDIMEELLIAPLPDDVKPFVHRLTEYWITDTAASVYRRAFAVVSMECHSPIIALANRTPAFYVRQKEDTIKGQMYYDVSLADWVFEIDEVDGDQIYERLRQIMADYPAAQAKVDGAYQIIRPQYEKAFQAIGQHIIT